MYWEDIFNLLILRIDWTALVRDNRENIFLNNLGDNDVLKKNDKKHSKYRFPLFAAYEAKLDRDKMSILVCVHIYDLGCICINNTCCYFWENRICLNYANMNKHDKYACFRNTLMQ